MLPARRSIRIRDFDYCDGWFYVTVCTADRARLFGEVIQERVDISWMGHLVEVGWMALPEHHPGVVLDAFVVMPNYLHGVLVLGSDAGTAGRAPTSEAFGRPVAGSLSTVVRSFKSSTTRAINQVRETVGAPVWQGGFYEHVIRNEKELERIRSYIEGNPANWATDRDNTS